MIPALLIVAAGAVVVAACEAFNRTQDAKAELLARRLDAQREAKHG